MRMGAYVAPSVICMPPMFINVGAYVDEGTMVDSHALVGSCAQIGKRVHLSAAAQIGGVLEPVNAAPVIIEDDVLVGGNCGVYEGTLVRIAGGAGSGNDPDAVDAALRYGARRGLPARRRKSRSKCRRTRWWCPDRGPCKKGQAAEWNLSLYTPVIVKYRDEKTDRRD